MLTWACAHKDTISTVLAAMKADIGVSPLFGEALDGGAIFSFTSFSRTFQCTANFKRGKQKDGILSGVIVVS